jgi:hypothetical protein
LERTVKSKSTKGGIFVDSCKFTPFGLCVKTELLRRGKTQKWLEEEITNRTGLFADSGYMDKILKGKRNAPRVVEAIREILEIQECDQDSTEPVQ